MTASLGLGTYRVRAVEQAARTACTDGLVWIDSAPNYADAHRLLGPVISDHPRAMVATKTGFFTRAEGEAATQAGLLTPQQVAAGHSLHPAFTRWQTERSLAVLGRADIVFVHNPEHSHHDRADLHERLRDVFAVLEEFATAGRIGGYGVATWSGFQHGAFTAPELLGLAKEASGTGEHHLRAVQQPVSLVMARPITLALDGRGPLVQARAAGLLTFGSSPLHGGELATLATPELAEFIRRGASPAAACLLAAASCPSLDVVLLSASTAQHWNAAKDAIASPLDPGQLRKVTDVLAQG
ncbi:aldo/keto reductase [Streptomyces agglomeratus]|uniref:Aldo/keto reductase n=1 Tax=Streptomyces agglomeratus TaxID=285458 RepID=A0A1E5NYB3_9ACTN|nr:aldo/keto reductase [Streptomyces agglomeratus]OEJ21257.1 aldo/keto reductase [Streptomyces agglomeratus]OEJ22695.1 aldo/keto reductase [Streptomyces agglomeratus]OEJ36644.1 aldo/keto reductase [Streptomyces agglomeratus]OEJ56364.1 aldo/keto reductase [Streptomyces agglomeratus]